MKRISEEEKQNILNSYKSRQPIQPLLFHTDNGSNYKSRSFMTYLKGLGVTQSFSRPHVPYDNSVTESFFSNMKREELYRTKYRSEKELRAAFDAYIKFYNGEHPHSKNQYKTPDRKEAEYYSKQAKKLRLIIRNCGVRIPYIFLFGTRFFTFLKCNRSTTTPLSKLKNS